MDRRIGRPMTRRQGSAEPECSPVHSFGDEADASDSHQCPLLTCCLNPGDGSVQEARSAR